MQFLTICMPEEVFLVNLSVLPMFGLDKLWAFKRTQSSCWFLTSLHEHMSPDTVEFSNPSPTFSGSFHLDWIPFFLSALKQAPVNTLSFLLNISCVSCTSTASAANSYDMSDNNIIFAVLNRFLFPPLKKKVINNVLKVFKCRFFHLDLFLGNWSTLTLHRYICRFKCLL